MPQYIATPDGGTVEFPDEMHPDQIRDVLRQKFGGGPAKSVAQDMQQEPRSAIGDFFKSIPRGIVGGLAATASASGQAEEGLMTGGGQQNLSSLITGQKQGVPCAEESRQLIQQHLTGEFPKPQGRAGKFGETLGEFLGNPASYVAPGGMAAKVGTAAASANGSEALGQATKGAAAEPWARMAGAMAGGAASGARVKIAGARAVAPTLEEITKGAKDAYKNLHNLDISLQPKVVSDMSDGIKNLLMNGNPEAEIQGGFRARNAPGTFDALEELKRPAGQGKLVKFADIDSVRQVLSRNAMGRDVTTGGMTTDALASQIAIEHIDRYLENIPQFAENARNARGNGAAKRSLEMVERQEFRGELNAATSGSGANLANTMRQRMKAILINDKMSARLTPEERDIAEGLAKGSKIANIARLVSKLGPKHPITGWGSALAADLQGGSGAAIATMSIGAAAQYISEKAVTGGVDRLKDTIARRAPV